MCNNKTGNNNNAHSVFLLQPKIGYQNIVYGYASSYIICASCEQKSRHYRVGTNKKNINSSNERFSTDNNIPFKDYTATPNCGSSPARR